MTLFKGLLKIRVKHFPAAFLFLNTLSGPILGTDVSTTLAWLGFFSSWTYLRFYKTSYADLSANQSPTLKGDASETFAMAYFFPDPLHRPVAIISEVVYNLLVSFRICTPFSAADISAGNSRAEARGDASLGMLLGGGRGAAQPGSARAEAERRRAIALKALDQRLHAAANKPPGSQAVVNGGGNGGVLGETSLDTEQAGP